MIRKALLEVLRHWPDRPNSLTVSRDVWEAILQEIHDDGIHDTKAGVTHIRIADTLLLPTETLAESD